MPQCIRRRHFSRCDQAASLSVPSAKNGRALEWTHCFSPSPIAPALCRQSAFMTIRAADAASLIGKIDSMSHAHCMAEFHTQFTPKKLNDWREGRALILVKRTVDDGFTPKRHHAGARRALIGGPSGTVLPPCDQIVERVN